MKNSAYYKEIARDALYGNWPVAVGTGFAASLLGGIIDIGGSRSNSSNSDSLNGLTDTLLSNQAVKYIILVIFIMVLFRCLVTLIIGGAVRFGYAKFNLNLVDNKAAAFSDLFSQLNRIGTGFLMNFLLGLYVFLWSLLFIIPGIIKSYAYSMTPYILSENHDLSVFEAIGESENMMKGNKMRLFYLRFSFIGWRLLCLVPVFLLSPITYYGTTAATLIYLFLVFLLVAVIMLFVSTYEQAAFAAFYRDVSRSFSLFGSQYYPPYEEPEK